MSIMQSPDKTQTMRSISRSLIRLNKAASQTRFRIKSLRVKTDQTQQKNCATDKDYQLQLIKIGFVKQQLKSLYILRSEQSQVKPSESKYNSFLKLLYQKTINTNTLNLSSCNFLKQSAQSFINQLIKINSKIISYDLSKCIYLAGYDQKSTNKWIIQRIIRNDKRIVKIVAKNIGFNAIDIKRLFDLAIQTQKLYEIDISNDSSQTMNRFGEQIDILSQFFKNNSSTSIVNLSNLNIRKIGVQHIQKAILINPCNPLRVLSIRNNSINQSACLHISTIVRTGLITLDISQNPLGPNFYLNMPSWKPSTVRNLNISQTLMTSQALIFFMQRLEQNKVMQNLVLDRNDLSHHWFNQMKQILIVNTSLQSISMVDCKIKRLSQTFSGLYHNKFIKKINVSNNSFDEGVKQLCELIRINKIIKQIKLKCCSLKTGDFVNIFQAISQNNKIILMDISENQLGQQGAKQLIKSLNKNNCLSQLIYQRVQIPFQYKQQIQKRLQDNRQLRKQKQFNLLKRQNRLVKQSDKYTWDDLQKLQDKVNENSKKISHLQNRVSGLQKQYDNKKFKFQQIMKDCGQKQRKLTSNIDNLLHKLKQLELEEQNYLKKFKIRQQNVIKAKEQQQSNIENLVKLIEEQGLRNKRRQNELQDQYQNMKYLQKKKQANKQISGSKKLIFDTSTAIASKRRSRSKI